MMMKEFNKALIESAFIAGVGDFYSYCDRADAFVAIGCPDNDGVIGAHPECTPGSLYTRPDHWDCQSGTYSGVSGNPHNGADVCCQYEYRQYYCSPTGLLGVKGDLRYVTNGACGYPPLGDTTSEYCNGDILLQADDKPLGPHDPHV